MKKARIPDQLLQWWPGDGPSAHLDLLCTHNDDFMCQPCWLAVNQVFRGKHSPATSNSCHFCELIKRLMRNESGIKQNYRLGFVLEENKGTGWTRHLWELQEAALGNVERQEQPWLCLRWEPVGLFKCMSECWHWPRCSREGTLPVCRKGRGGNPIPTVSLDRNWRGGRKKQLHASN